MGCSGAKEVPKEPAPVPEGKKRVRPKRASSEGKPAEAEAVPLPKTPLIWPEGTKKPKPRPRRTQEAAEELGPAPTPGTDPEEDERWSAPGARESNLPRALKRLEQERKQLAEGGHSSILCCGPVNERQLDWVAQI